MSKFFSREPIDVDFINTKHRRINSKIPCEGSVEILDNQKRIASGAIIKVQLDEASTMGVQLSAKKITV